MSPAVTSPIFRAENDPTLGRVYAVESSKGKFPARLLIRADALTESTFRHPDFNRDVPALLSAITQETEIAAWRGFLSFSSQTRLFAQGRSIYRPSSTAEGSHITLRAKGVTADGSSPEPVPYKNDSSTGIKAAANTFRIRDERLFLEPAECKPHGFMLYSDALREFRSALLLHKAGIPTPVPLGIGRFTQTHFTSENHELGFVLYVHQLRGSFSSRNFGDQRADDISDPYYAEQYYTAAFRLLRAMHDAGFTHGQPHLRNFSFSAPGEALTMLDFETVKTPEEHQQGGGFINFFWFRDLLALLNSAHDRSLSLSEHPSGAIDATRADTLVVNAFINGYLKKDELPEFQRKCLRADLSAAAIHHTIDHALHENFIAGVNAERVTALLRKISLFSTIFPCLNEGHQSKAASKPELPFAELAFNRAH